ncbi:MAG: GldG family protein [Gemmataceae bacterium]|nr:GldG family protein [Gemmataceae bacterium]
MATDSTQEQRELSVQKAYALLLLGGLAGGILLIGDLIAAWYWWGPLVDFLRDDNREKLWQPLLALVALLVGLAVPFLAFQAARRYERVDATLRRVLYGYNAVLSLLLLAMLLTIICVFVWLRYPLPYDTTQGGFYSLGERTRQYIAELDKPVVVYMLLDPEDDMYPGAYQGMQVILEQMQSINPRFFRFEDVPIDGTSPGALRDLVKRFPQISLRAGGGVLVAVGDKPENNYSFIQASELINFDLADRANPQRSFNGEVRLLQELYFLGEEKRRPIVYITQGHGEPDFSDRGPDGLAQLVQRLTNANYDVRPLQVDTPDIDKFNVPPDAEVVVVAGPRRPMLDMIPALKRYMNPTDEKARKGRLVVLLGPTGPDRSNNNQMVSTGLEDFLREVLGVTATKQQVLTFRIRGSDLPIVRGNQPYPEAVLVTPVGRALDTRHPLALLVGENRVIWTEVRKLEAAPGGSANNRLQADVVLQADGFVWLEENMGQQTLATWQKLVLDPEEQRKRVTADRSPVLITVSESPPTADPHGFDKPNQGRSPRAVVIGCSAFLTNEMMPTQGGGINFDLVRGSIDWCRERYSTIGVEPKSYRYFILPKQTSYWNLFYLPLAAMALGVLGLGVIVWNVRRS